MRRNLGNLIIPTLIYQAFLSNWKWSTTFKFKNSSIKRIVLRKRSFFFINAEKASGLEDP